MKDSISNITACVIDCGLFLPVARRMAESCKRVLFYPYAWDRGYPSVKQASVGMGFDNLEHTLDFWDQLDEIDLFILPDVGRSGLQNHLESIGKLVWGSRKGSNIELGRERFMDLLGELKLEVPPHTVIEGVDALRDHLRDKENKYIKISKWRGDMETTKWRNWNMDRGWLDWLSMQFGPLRNLMRFLVFDEIETDLEIGGDTYNVRGQWPSLMLNGIEWKDNSYLSAVTQRSDMPEQIKTVLDAMGPVLGENDYANQWSMEVRVKDEHFYFNDATTRGGIPSTASQCKVWKNFPEIVLAGAQGELVEPEPAAMFTIECMIKSKVDCEQWDEVEIDPDLEPHTMFSGCCLVDGILGFPPEPFSHGDLGWLVALGDTPRQALDEAKRLADMLPDGLEANCENLANVISEIDTMQEKHIPFTSAPMPEPAEAIEN